MLPDNVKQNATTFLQAVARDEVALIEFEDRAGDPAYFLTIVQEADDGTCLVMPVAQMFAEDPRDRLIAPDLD